MKKNVQNKQSHVIEPNQLCVGLYVHLDVGWMDHPFAFSNFKIEHADQVAKIKKIGLKSLRYDPLRSDVQPLPLVTEETITESTITIETPTEADVDTHPSPKSFKEERLIQLHQAIDENEKKFIAASKIAKSCTENFIKDPKTSVKQADTLVSEMISVALTEGDVAIHAINGNPNEEEYQHSMNVLALSLMMSQTLDLTKDDAKTLGIAALFHDIGKLNLRQAIRSAKPPLNRAQALEFETHSALGAQLALDAGLSDHVANIIMQHHELMDGSGYPKQLEGEKIDQLARLVGLVSNYDDLCNPLKTVVAKTPYEALSFLFANQRTKYDENILKRMIKTMGIYPPGSIVQLSSGIYANVISGNTNHPLRPFVMLHDSAKKNDNPTIIDLREEPNLHISICLRPSQLPPDILDFFKPSKRINFFLNKELSSPMINTDDESVEKESPTT